MNYGTINEFWEQWSNNRTRDLMQSSTYKDLEQSLTTEEARNYDLCFIYECKLCDGPKATNYIALKKLMGIALEMGQNL